MAHRKYNWEDWFSRAEVIIVYGVDYHCSQSTMVQTIRNEASKRGLRVSVIDAGNEIYIGVRHGAEPTGKRVPTSYS